MTSPTNNTERSVAEVGEVRQQAREILNRHCEYVDGLDRGQRWIGTGAALDAVIEALSSRHRTEAEARVGEVEVLRDVVAAAITNMPICVFKGWAKDGRAWATPYQSKVDEAYARADRVLAALKPTELSEAKVERIVENAIYAADFPKTHWSCSDDESGTKLTLERFRRFIAQEVRAALAAAEGQACLTDSQGSGSVRG